MKKIPVRKIAENSEISSLKNFKIRNVTDLLKGSDLRHELHRHDFFFILALQKGKGSHQIDFNDYNVSDNIVFVIRPGQVHHLELKAGSTGYLMEFNAEFYPQENTTPLRLRKATNKNYYRPGDTGFKKLYSILSDIFLEYRNREEGYSDVIKANLDIFFIELVRQNRGNDTMTNVNPYAQARFEDFVELLEATVSSNKKVSQYADLMNLSAYQLNGITKALAGKTASELINEHVVLEAKRHLLATTDQVKEVADHLGYEDVSYFIRFFRRHTGLSPDTFRQNFR